MATAFLQHTPTQSNEMWSQLIGKESATYKAGTFRESGSTALEGAGQSGSSLTRSAGSSASLAPPSSTKSLGGLTRLAPGELVRIGGMQRRADLNGSRGRVVSEAPDAQGRICVELGPTPASQEARVLRVLASRLSPERHHHRVGDASALGFPAFGVANTARAAAGWASAARGASAAPEKVQLAPQWERHRGFRRKANGAFYGQEADPQD